MSLVAVVAGRYSASFTPGSGGAGAGALDQGVTDENGYQLAVNQHAQMVNGTDAYAQTLVETIYQGMDWRLRYVAREYPSVANKDAGTSLNALLPWGKVTGANSSGPLSPVMGVIARRGSDVEGSIVLTSTTGTPSAANPTTLTASHVVAAPNTNASISFTSKVREVPVDLILFPYTTTLNATSYTLWYVTT